jgi:hypothetical protein
VLAALAGVDAVIHGAMAAGDDAAAAFGASVTSVHHLLATDHVSIPGIKPGTDRGIPLS